MKRTLLTIAATVLLIMWSFFCASLGVARVFADIKANGGLMAGGVEYRCERLR